MASAAVAVAAAAVVAPRLPEWEMFSDRVTKRFRGNELFLMPRSRVPHIQGSFIVKRGSWIPANAGSYRRDTSLRMKGAPFGRRMIVVCAKTVWIAPLHFAGLLRRARSFILTSFSRCGIPAADHFSLWIRCKRDSRDPAALLRYAAVQLFVYNVPVSYSVLQIHFSSNFTVLFVKITCDKPQVAESRADYYLCIASSFSLSTSISLSLFLFPSLPSLSLPPSLSPSISLRNRGT